MNQSFRQQSSSSSSFEDSAPQTLAEPASYNSGAPTPDAALAMQSTCGNDMLQSLLAPDQSSEPNQSSEAPPGDGLDLLIELGKRYGKLDALSLPSDLKTAQQASKLGGTVAEQAANASRLAGPANRGLKGAAGAYDAYTVAKGAYNMYDGVTGDEAMDDVHMAEASGDLLSGGAGLISMVPGPVGMVAQAFSGGYGVGEMLAPHVFGEERQGAFQEDIPEDGTFHPTTGNQYVDAIFGIGD